MPTVAQLRDADPARLEAAVQDWAALATVVEGEASGGPAGEIAALRDGRWHGHDAEAAFRVLAREEERLRGCAHGTRCEVAVVEAFVQAVRTAQTDLAALLDEARGLGLVVGDDGTVACPPDTMPDGGHDIDERGRDVTAWHEWREAGARRLTGELTALLARTAEADTRLAADLARARDELPDGPCFGTAAADDATRLDPRTVPSGNPGAAAAWWASLDAVTRDTWLAARPDVIGALDGLPCAVRDTANRVVLGRTEERVRADLAGVLADVAALGRRGAGRGAGTEFLLRAGRFEAELGDMQALRSALADADPGRQQAFLLAFDPEGAGRAAVAVGDPDRAACVGVLVPGTGAGLAGITRDVARARALQAQARYVAGLPGGARTGDATDGGGVSVVAWVGYRAPATLPKAVKSSYARDAAPVLDGFLTGLRASRARLAGPGVPPAHLTVIGHSYGSVVVGEAALRMRAQGSRLPVDDVIAVGSPGMHVAHAADLGIGTAHVWAAAADGDPVPVVGAVAHGAPDAASAVPLVPSDPQFGANDLTTDGVRGHSGYWDADRHTSLDNQAAVIAGRYGKVGVTSGESP